MVEIRHEPGPGMKNLEILTKGLNGLEGKVGWPASAKYEDGTSIAYIAAIQEFGSPKNSIPPRSFIRTTIVEKQESWKKLIEKGAQAVMNGRDPSEVMELLLLGASGDIRKKITEIQTPPLSMITLMARKYRQGSDAEGNPNKVTGKTIGMFAKELAKGPQDVSGVSTKPLVDSGLLLASLTYEVHKT